MSAPRKRRFIPHYNGELYDSGWGEVGEVRDMAYDAKNDTMYLTYYGVDVVERFGNLWTQRSPMKLGTVDLLTGEITELGVLSELSPATGEYEDTIYWALACDDDGNLYGLEHGMRSTPATDPETGEVILDPWTGEPMFWYDEIVTTLYRLSVQDTIIYYDFDGDGDADYDDGNALLDVATGLRSRDSLSNTHLLDNFITGGSISSYTGYEFLQHPTGSERNLAKTEITELEVAGTTCYLTWDSYEDELVLSVDGEDEDFMFFDRLYTVNPRTGEVKYVADTDEINYSCLLTALFVDPGDNAEVLPDTADAASVTLSETSLTMIPGASAALTAALKPWNLADRTVTWTSSDPAVATVNAKGVVRAVSGGKTTITASTVTPGVTAACEVEVVGLDTTLNALVWGDEAIVHWASFPVSDPGSWQDLGAFNESFVSAAQVGGQVYAALDRGSLYAVDPSTQTSTLLGNTGGFLVDLAEMPSTGHLLGVSSSFILDVDPKNPDESNENPVGWTAEDKLGTTTYFVACAYLGESTIHDTIGIYNKELGDFDEITKDWPVSVYALIDWYGDVYYFACENETGFHVSWIDLYCRTGYEVADARQPYFNSAVYAYNKDGVPALFWSYYTTNSSQLLAISLDGEFDSDDLNGTFLGDLGDFGVDAWPVIGLMSEEAPPVPSSVTDVLNSGKMQQLGAAQSVNLSTPNSDETAAVSEPVDDEEDEEAFVENAADVSENVEVSGEPEVPEDDMETLSMSVNSSAAAPSVDSRTGEVTLDLKLDASSTNGLIQVEYDTSALKLTDVNGNAVLNSFNTTQAGVVRCAYAYKSAKAAGTTVATLHFVSLTMEDTAVTVTTQERGRNTGLNEVETVLVGIDVTPGGNFGPTYPSIPVNPTQPAAPTEPEKPDEPTEPTEPGEPENPGTATQPAIPVINVPAAPAPAEIEEIIAPYTDLQSGEWYSEYAAYVIDNGMMRGTGTAKFEPDTPLTRAMLVTIIYRAADEPVAGTAPFRDVPADAWFASSVAWAASNELVNGRGEGIFDPDGNITRQELATILWRFAKAMGLDVSANGMTMPDFADRGEIASWAGEAMAWAYHNGIIKGRDSTHLAPNDCASRIEAAAMVVRFLKLIENSQNPKV